MDGLVHIAGLVTWTRKNRRIASANADREHGIGAERGEVGMSATEKVVNDLNVSKLMLCNPKMLTSEMYVRIGQAINGAIDLLKEQEPRVLTADELYLMEHKCVYLERRNSKVYSTEPSIVIGTSKALFCQYKYFLMRENKISDVRYSSDYNKETKSGWRCWSAKPTEERRKEVKWE